MTKNTRFSPEVRQRAVRMVLESQGEYDSQWAAICSIAPKIGCTPETLRVWVRQHERDTGGGDGGLTTAERQRLKELERENRELRRSNDILRQASAYFAKADQPDIITMHHPSCYLQIPPPPQQRCTAETEYQRVSGPEPFSRPEKLRADTVPP